MNKFVKLSFILVMITLSSCHVGRYFYYNFADVKDYKKFPQEPIEASLKPHILPYSKSEITIPGYVNIDQFEPFLEKNKTLAFLILKNDSIVYEKYSNKYNETSVIPSFSVAKSFVSALIGIAINEGHIHSVDDPITKYLSFIDSVDISKITIRHVLDMRSGLKFNESYVNPFGDVAKYYYGTNTTKYLNKIKAEKEPGKEFDYISANTQILSEIIEKTTGKSFLEYFTEKLWKPLEPEFPASWNLDSKKNHNYKTFCCLNARARDFSRLGLLYLHNGQWRGNQVVPKKWVEESTTFTEEKNFYLYSYHWWHNNEVAGDDVWELSRKDLFDVVRNKADKNSIQFEPYQDFFAQGILGQYVYVHPKSNLVIVRLGKGNGDVNWPRLFKEIAEKNL